MSAGTLRYFIYPWDPVDLFVTATTKGVSRIIFGKDLERDFFPKISNRSTLIKDANYFAQLAKQFDLYFSGKRVDWQVSPDLASGTPFQVKIWNYLRKIPYGTTVTYGQVAIDQDIPDGARAVGQANGANPVPIIIPCHRVIAARGKLGGYSAGINIKEILLRVEGVLI